jgi:hypothetical protein
VWEKNLIGGSWKQESSSLSNIDQGKELEMWDGIGRWVKEKVRLDILGRRMEKHGEKNKVKCLRRKRRSIPNKA